MAAGDRAQWLPAAMRRSFGARPAQSSITSSSEAGKAVTGTLVNRGVAGLSCLRVHALPNCSVTISIPPECRTLPSLPLRVDCSREIPVHSAHDVLEVIGIEPFGQHIARIHVNPPSQLCMARTRGDTDPSRCFLARAYQTSGPLSSESRLTRRKRQ